jgi:membrane-associated protease RseP (regulator of RpoE activity)
LKYSTLFIQLYVSKVLVRNSYPSNGHKLIYRAMHAATVAIHPLVIAGWCGLTTTAFNMLPVGCLDGGRALQVKLL